MNAKKLSKNSELLLELKLPVTKSVQEDIGQTIIPCASCLGNLPKPKSVLALLKTSLWTTNTMLLYYNPRHRLTERWGLCALRAG